jgi:hypothetical protein
MAITDIIMVDTKIITAAEEAKPHPPIDYVMGLGAFILGAALILSGIPRLIAALRALPGEEIVNEIRQKRLPAKADILNGADALAAANYWQPSAERESDQGLLLLKAAELASDPAENAVLFQAAESVTAHALAIGPQQPSAWLRLAYLRERRGDFVNAALALRESMLSGAYIPVLMQSRLEMALRLAPFMNKENLELVKRQVRLTWIYLPDFIEDLRRDSVHGPFIAEALGQLSNKDLEFAARLSGKH